MASYGRVGKPSLVLRISLLLYVCSEFARAFVCVVPGDCFVGRRSRRQVEDAMLSRRGTGGHEFMNGWRRPRFDAPNGAQSLSAVYHLPPLNEETVRTFSQELLFHGARHHWRSGLLGGFVGVTGTLMAIRVRDYFRLLL